LVASNGFVNNYSIAVGWQDVMSIQSVARRYRLFRQITDILVSQSAEPSAAMPRNDIGRVDFAISWR
jgi:ribosomal protein S4E